MRRLGAEGVILSSEPEFPPPRFDVLHGLPESVGPQQGLVEVLAEVSSWYAAEWKLEEGWHQKCRAHQVIGHPLWRCTYGYPMYIIPHTLSWCHQLSTGLESGAR